MSLISLVIINIYFEGLERLELWIGVDSEGGNYLV